MQIMQAGPTLHWWRTCQALQRNALPPGNGRWKSMWDCTQITVFVGNIGGTKRFDYSIAGLAVIVASRLPAIARERAVSILATGRNSREVERGPSRCAKLRRYKFRAMTR